MAQPKGFIPDAPVIPAGFVPDQAPQPEPSWFQRYVAGPATRATAGTLAGLGETALLPLDLVASLGQRAGLVPETSPFGLNVRGGGLSAAEQAAQAPARFLVPQSGIEAGALLATGGAGPLVSAAGKAVPVLARAPGWLSRIVASTLGGELGGQATGEPTGKGAAIGGGAALAGESMLTLGSKLVRSLPGMQTWIDSRMARQLGQAIEEISQPLKGARTAQDLQQLAVEGERKLGLAKGQIVQHIEGHTPPLTLPAFGPTPMTLSEANTKLTALGRHAYGPAGTFADQQAYRARAEEIAAGLDQVDPTGAARPLWERAQAAYRKGLGLIDLLTPKSTFTRGPAGVRLKTPTVQEYLADPRTQQELRARLHPEEFAHLADVLTRGGGVGTKDRLKSLYPTTLTGGLLSGGLGGAGLYGGGAGLGGLLGALPLLTPNLLSRYAGRAPYTAPEGARLAIDLLAGRTLGAIAADALRSAGPPPAAR